MKKLYLATRTHSVMFLSAEFSKERLMEDADHWIKEQNSWYIPEIEVVEIKAPEQIPAGWRGGQLIWGTDKEICATDFLKSVDKDEYEEYLRLKAKYE